MPDAWAVAESGEINMRTVHDHPRGAMVNWICLIYGRPMSNSVEDETIREIFLFMAPPLNAKLVPLVVHVDAQADPVDPATVQLVPEGVE